MNAKTPRDLTITPRDRRFARGGRARWWLNDDPVATAFFNALSVTFPEGERFFIDAVRAHRDGVGPRLAAEIAAFVRQEAIHTREHVAFNRHVTDQGYDVSRLEARVDADLALPRGRPPIAALAVTLALEHFTAILAHELLADARYLEGADPTAAELWRWHAIEEIEHKGVAYDCWAHATREWSGWRRWRVRSLVMLITTWRFVAGRTAGVLDLLEQDGLSGWRTRARLLRYALVRPGMVRKVAATWGSFFLPGFHPWRIDDRVLIGRADSVFAAARAAG